MRSALMLVILFSVIPVSAQTTKETNINVDAAEKHIVLTQYHNDQAVTLSGQAAGGWRLYAGAAIDAQRIDLTMRNVRAQARFHADWSRVTAILDRVERQRATAAPVR